MSESAVDNICVTMYVLCIFQSDSFRKKIKITVKTLKTTKTVLSLTEYSIDIIRQTNDSRFLMVIIAD